MRRIRLTALLAATAAGAGLAMAVGDNMGFALSQRIVHIIDTVLLPTS